MGRMALCLGCLAVLLSCLNVAAFADEQDELEAQLLAVVKQQQALEQQRRSLNKKLEDAKAKAADARVKIEVKGTLFLLQKGGTAYGIRANKGTVLVRFIRTEDKNNALDERMKSFEGKTVSVHGFLEWVDENAPNALVVLLYDENQVNLLGEQPIRSKE